MLLVLFVGGALKKTLPLDTSGPLDLYFGRGDDTVGNPHRAQISQFDVFERIFLLKFDIRGESSHMCMLVVLLLLIVCVLLLLSLLL